MSSKPISSFFTKPSKESMLNFHIFITCFRLHLIMIHDGCRFHLILCMYKCFSTLDVFRYSNTETCLHVCLRVDFCLFSRLFFICVHACMRVYAHTYLRACVRAYAVPAYVPSCHRQRSRENTGCEKFRTF